MAENLVINGTTYPGVTTMTMTNESGEKVGFYPDAVRFNEQTLTDEQKAIARENIGAGPVVVQIETEDDDGLWANYSASEIKALAEHGREVVFRSFDGDVGFAEWKLWIAGADKVEFRANTNIVEGAVLHNTHVFVDDGKNVWFDESSLMIPSKQEIIDEILGAGEPAEYDIPKVFFGDALPQTKDDVIMSFRYISKTKDISGWCKTKAQGNSSMSYPKKNQTVKLYENADCAKKLKVDFKGWGNQNKFCFKANWIDLTHARNIVSARLWADIVKSRTYYGALPEELRTSPNQGAVDGFPVKVYAGGVYQGRYTINIPKDPWMANMDDDLDNHCILCGENYGSGCFRASANINGGDWTDEVHDTVPEAIKTRWNEIISFVMNSTDEEFKANLGNYFFVDSLIDYYLFGLASCGLDAFGKNQLYMTYDGRKWAAVMYDMDSTWGLWWNGATFVSSEYARSEFQDFKDGEGNLLYIRLASLFSEEIVARWKELRSGPLSIDNVIIRFEQFTYIAPAKLVEEDYATTTGGGAFTGIPSKTTNNIQQLRVFAQARLVWTNENLVPIPCTGITISDSSVELTGNGSTHTLTVEVVPTDTTDKVVWISSNTKIATVSDGVVRANDNGEATITAICGNQMASCTVAVSGIEAPAPYALINGTYTGGGGTLTISNGNHVKIDLIEPLSTIALNLSDVTANIGSLGNTVNWISDKEIFTLSAGDVVTRKLTNVTTTIEGNLSSSFNLFKVSGGEVRFGYDIIYTSGSEFEATITISADCSIAMLGCWISTGSQFPATIEFDVELTVNGERYI